MKSVHENLPNAINHYYLNCRKDFEPNGLYLCEIAPCQREPKKPIDEAIELVKKIYSKNREITVCMSGGVDSQAMAYSFIKANVPFKVAILMFSDNLNRHDLKEAFQFCEEFKIPFKVYEIDILNFFESNQYKSYSKKYRCYSPQLIVHLYLLDLIDDFAVMAGNPIQMTLNQRGKYSFNMPSDLYFCYERYFKKNNKEGLGLFFMATPELIYSFWRCPSFKQLLSGKNLNIDSSSYEFKIKLYNEGGFKVNPQSTKQTGFEFIREYYQKKFPGENPAFDLMFRAPLVESFPPPRQVYYKIPRAFLFS